MAAGTSAWTVEVPDVDILDILAVVPDVDPAAADPRGGAIDGDAIDHQLVRVEGQQADVAEPGGGGDR